MSPLPGGSCRGRSRSRLRDERAEPGYLFGTDNLDRDILSRLLHGARVALFAAAATAVAGLLAGCLGGWVDTLVSRLVDVRDPNDTADRGLTATSTGGDRG